jgi:hypothetical protein
MPFDYRGLQGLCLSLCQQCGKTRVQVQVQHHSGAWWGLWSHVQAAYPGLGHGCIQGHALTAGLPAQMPYHRV